MKQFLNGCFSVLLTSLALLFMALILPPLWASNWCRRQIALHGLPPAHQQELRKLPQAGIGWTITPSDTSDAHLGVYEAMAALSNIHLRRVQAQIKHCLKMNIDNWRIRLYMDPCEYNNAVGSTR